MTKKLATLAAAVLFALSMSAIAAEEHHHDGASCAKMECCKMKDGATCNKDAKSECCKKMSKDGKSCCANGKCSDSKSCDMHHEHH